MNTRTGQILPMSLLSEEQKKSGEWVELSDEMTKLLLAEEPRQRPSLMRNQPCTCGSGAKVKR